MRLLPFFRTSLPVAGFEGVLRLDARLRAERGVDDEDELAFGRFKLQNCHAERVVKVGFLPRRAFEEPGNLRSMDALGGDDSPGLRAAHATAMENKGQHHSQDHCLGKVVQTGARNKTLDLT